MQAETPNKAAPSRSVTALRRDRRMAHTCRHRRLGCPAPVPSRGPNPAAAAATTAAAKGFTAKGTTPKQDEVHIESFVLTDVMAGLLERTHIEAPLRPGGRVRGATRAVMANLFRARPTSRT